jgi:hypothetical protein
MTQITEIIEKIASVTGQAGGRISTENLDFPSSSNIDIENFPVPGRLDPVAIGFDKPKTFPATHQTPYDWMVEQCLRWNEYEQLTNEGNNEILWRQLINMIRTLQRRGWLCDSFHLVHSDLYPRNFMAVMNGDAIEISGVVDWDDAILAPKFMALRSPFWAWAGEQYEEDALAEPASIVGIIAKNAFCEAASSEFKRFAFSTQAILARQLFDFLHSGILTESAREDAVGVLGDWDRFFPSDQVQQVNTE